jgi:competence protein ComEC
LRPGSQVTSVHETDYLVIAVAPFRGCFLFQIMRSAVIGFAIGVGWLQCQASLPAPATLVALMAAVLLGIIAVRRIGPPELKVTGLVAAGALCGFAWAAAFAHWQLQHELPRALEGRDITLIGTIDSLPAPVEQGVRFNFAVERVKEIAGGGDVASVPHRLALSWYAGFEADNSEGVAPLRAGERWQLTVRLRRPHGNANPQGFDYEVWLLEQGLRATGYVRPDAKSAAKNRRLDDFVPGLRHAVERARGHLRDRIESSLGERPYAGVIVALVVGDQRAVSQSEWKVFNRTGVGHLISISGLHITMISGLFAALVMWLWRRSFFTRACLPLLMPAHKAAAVAGVLAALFYVLLAGFGVPAQRTLYMLTVVGVALWCGRIASVSHVLAVALAVVMVFDPWAVLWPGFWLSFSAVGVILYASAGRGETQSGGEGGSLQAWRQSWRAGLRSASRTQYAVTVGLVPLSLLLFGQMSLISPLANAVAIPLISFAVTPLSLLGAVAPDPLSGWLLQLAHAGVEALAGLLHWMSGLPLAVWRTPLPPSWMFMLALLGTLWMLAPRGWPLRMLGLLAWAPLVLLVPAHPPDGEAWITAFDVGQGTALLVETRNHRLLYDTGPYYSPESDGGSRVILPYLNARGIRRLDGLVISHSDNDHSGGALSILEEIEAGWVASSLPYENPIVEKAQKAGEHRRCAAGQSWDWDGVRFEMLHPTMDSYASQKLKPNGRSCTLKVTLGRQSVLLAGDIESPQEAELVGRDPELLRASVLLAPHHGSGTSSTTAFLNAVKPELALFQVGYRNRYRHPKQEVFERYGRMGIKRLRSDESGAVMLKIRDGVMDVAEYRTEHARYWYGR